MSLAQSKSATPSMHARQLAENSGLGEFLLACISRHVNKQQTRQHFSERVQNIVFVKQCLCSRKRAKLCQHCGALSLLKRSEYRCGPQGSSASSRKRLPAGSSRARRTRSSICIAFISFATAAASSKCSYSLQFFANVDI